MRVFLAYLVHLFTLSGVLLSFLALLASLEKNLPLVFFYLALALFVDNNIGGAAATGLGEEVIKSSGSFLVVELMRQGYDPASACKEALDRVIKAHNGNPDFQICYIALRKDGEVGAACLKWAFSLYGSPNHGIL